MPNYLVTICEEHGVKVTSDRASQNVYRAAALDCVEFSAQDAREHALEHRISGHDCWSCCDKMRVANDGETEHEGTRAMWETTRYRLAAESNILAECGRKNDAAWRSWSAAQANERTWWSFYMGAR